MSTNRSRRIDRATAEHLLNRGGADVPAGQNALADVLAAAAAPATDSELLGEQAALAAFRAGPLAPAPPPRRRSMVSATLAKLLSAKVIAAVAATALGGVAVAAGTGHLPAVLPDGPTRTTPTHPSPSNQPTPGASPNAGSTDGSSDPGLPQQPAGSSGPTTIPTTPGASVGADHGNSAPKGHGGGRPSTRPTAHGTGRPSTAPSKHVTGAPSRHPTK